MRACVDTHILILSMFKHRNATMQCQCDVVIQLLVKKSTYAVFDICIYNM